MRGGDLPHGDTGLIKSRSHDSETGDPDEGFGIGRPQPVRAMVVVPDHAPSQADQASRSIEARLEEAEGLARAIHLDVVETRPVRIRKINPGTYFGPGQVESFGEFAEAGEVTLFIADCALSPVQQRNLEKAMKIKVLDRTALILEIFGERAETKAGRLQVELAHLEYQKGRLVRSWTHLERQRGGGGFMGGPGETQIESDRRALQDKITRIRKHLEQVEKTRKLQRKKRKKAPVPVAAFVGYTNAGKSTLFNRLTDSDIFAKDLLFATLDPTLRRIKLPSGTPLVLSDTVGFVSDLPTELIAAFRSTLEEVLEADFLIHVRDISHPDTEEQAADVLAVLESLGLSGSELDAMIEIHNKIDRIAPEDRPPVEAGAEKNVIQLSAVTGEGVGNLVALLEERLHSGSVTADLVLSGSDGEGLAWLYRHTEVISRETDPETGLIELQIRYPAQRASQIAEFAAEHSISRPDDSDSLAAE